MKKYLCQHSPFTFLTLCGIQTWRRTQSIIVLLSGFLSCLVSESCTTTQHVKRDYIEHWGVSDFFPALSYNKAEGNWPEEEVDFEYSNI